MINIINNIRLVRFYAIIYHNNQNNEINSIYDDFRLFKKE